MRKAFAIAGVLFLFWSPMAAAEEDDSNDVRRQIVILNKNYVNLIKALKGLENEIKDFTNTTLNISLVKPKDHFRLISIEIFDNDQLIVSHIYSPLETEALDAGGRQLLHKGELKNGKHNLKVSYVWTKGDESPKKETAPISFSATMGKNYFIELSFRKNGAGALLHYSQLVFDDQKQ